jgi:hypothetical protein
VPFPFAEDSDARALPTSANTPLLLPCSAHAIKFREIALAR